MGLVEFADSDGVRWRAWHVETPPSRAHLMDPQYRQGWLVFERQDGAERRRLSPVPEGWASMPSKRLALMCRAAIPVVAGKTTPTGPNAVWSQPDTDAR